jgi:hypothetical protein
VGGRMINFFRCCNCVHRFCKDFASFNKATEKGREVHFDSRNCRKFTPYDTFKAPFLSLAFTHSDESANAVVRVLSRANLKLKDYRFFK